MTNRKLSKQDLMASQNLKRIWLSKRRLLGLTQAKAAILLGFSNQSAVSQYINGLIPLGLGATLNFSQLLEVDPVEIRPELVQYAVFVANSEKQNATDVAENRSKGIPLLNETQISAFLAGQLHDVDYYPAISNLDLSSQSFCLILRQRSMQPLLNQNDHIYINPDIQLSTLKPSVWFFPASLQMAIGFYEHQGDHRFLSFENPAFPVIELAKSAQYLGSVVGKVAIFSE